jgi:SAM-dependent methyltransferase
MGAGESEMKSIRSSSAAALAVATGLLSFFLNQYWQALLLRLKLQHHATLATVALFGIVFVILIGILPSLEKITTWIWNRSIRVRQARDILRGEPSVEGWWLDVGIDTTGDQNELLNYSSIVIVRKHDDFHVQGTTWDLFGKDPAGSEWVSEYCEFKDDRMILWYTGRRPGLDYSRAEYHFAKIGRKHATSFTGTYGSYHFKSIGKFQSLVTKQDPKTAAERYMQQYSREQNYDSFGMQSPVAPAAPPAQREWYRAFVRNSDKEKKEVELLLQTIAHLKNEQFSAILDIGPADGSLTEAVLRQIVKRRLIGPDLSYCAVEPSGAHLDSIESKLVKALPGRKFTLLKHRIEDYLPQLKAGSFDLILLFNVLYYVRGLDELGSQIGKLLKPEGMVLSLHTDIQRDKFLRKLIENTNPELHLNIVDKIESLGKGLEMKSLERVEGQVTLSFPEIADDRWDAIEGGALYQDTSMGDATDLICFLVDKSAEPLRTDGKWRDVVASVREHLRATGNIVALPIVAQVLRRKP